MPSSHVPTKVWAWDYYESTGLHSKHVGGGAVTAMMSELTSQHRFINLQNRQNKNRIRKSTKLEPYHMAYLKLPFYTTQNWNFTTWHLWVCWFYKNWKFNKPGTSPHGITGFADSTKTGNSTKLELHHMTSLDLLICKNRKSAKLELHNMVSLELPFLWTSILPDPCPIL